MFLEAHHNFSQSIHLYIDSLQELLQLPKLSTVTSQCGFFAAKVGAMGQVLDESSVAQRIGA